MRLIVFKSIGYVKVSVTVEIVMTLRARPGQSLSWSSACIRRPRLPCRRTPTATAGPACLAGLCL